MQALHYLYEVAYRTAEGGISHLGTFDLLGVTLWVDSLFMFGNVLTKWGEHMNDTKALKEYLFQFDVFTSVLQEGMGFYKHAYQSTFEQDDNVYWGRGNGWITAAAYDHLRVRLNRGERADSMCIAIKRQVDAILKTQDQATGLWWTILNRPGETYLETSVSALFAYGMARGFRYGYLGLSKTAPLPPVKLNPDMVDNIHHNGGTILSSSRGPRDIGEIVQTLVKNKVNILFAIPHHSIRSYPLTINLQILSPPSNHKVKYITTLKPLPIV